MRVIDPETWPRREQFRLFRGFNHPHFSLCANVDLTAFYPAVKERGVSFTVALVYVLAREANAIPEFRYRLRGDQVVEHEVVHPSITLLTGEDLFSFCSFQYRADFAEFASLAAETMASVKDQPALADEPGDDLLFMTAIPWVSFTSFQHPMRLHPADSIPRLAWGKMFEEGERLKMPLSVQGHHALMDGVHAGRYYAQVQADLDQPGVVLGER